MKNLTNFLKEDKHYGYHFDKKYKAYDATKKFLENL